MIIKNVGYMWHRKYVNWQKGNELIGYSENDDTKVDFAYQAGIYALYDRNSSCVYVGQAGKGENVGLYCRLKNHTDDHLFCMWERFSWFGFYSSDTIRKGTDAAFNKEYDVKTDVNELMNVIEALILRTFRPSCNLSLGSLLDVRGKDHLEWFYQKAEWEERQAEFNNLKKICKSL